MQMDMSLADTTRRIAMLRDTHVWRINSLARWDGYETSFNGDGK